MGDAARRRRSAGLSVVAAVVMIAACTQADGAQTTADRVDHPTTTLVLRIHPSSDTSPAQPTSTDALTPGTAASVPDSSPPDPTVLTDPSDSSPVGREVPPETTVPPFSFVSPWADDTIETPTATWVALGCAGGTDAASLDRFLTGRLGPLLGEDYQHVYPLGGKRYLWLFQDAFVDHTGLASRLDDGAFLHNIAVVQDGDCFTLAHGGTIFAPTSFEPGTGERRLSRWFWPMGGELTDAGLQVFWVEMSKDGYTPSPGDGLGWHPVTTYLATYDPVTLARRSFVGAANPGVAPIYGYAVASDESYTYLFGNTFEQNLVREGGFGNGPHSATSMWLGRVPLHRLGADPEYRTADGWSPDATFAVPVSSRYWVENPMQPRFIDGVWVAATKVDGYWGARLAIDVANDPWGPWQNVATTAIAPRGGDPLMNTYHAQLLPWRDRSLHLLVTLSENARDMTADAFPVPERYRPSVFAVDWATPAPREETTTTTVVDLTAPPTTEAPTTTETNPATTEPAPTSVATTIVANANEADPATSAASSSPTIPASSTG